MKVLFAALLTLIITLSSATNSFAVEYGIENKYSESAYSATFSDVSSNHWAYEYIAEMVNRGILSGYPNGKFYPNNMVTRAEFAKIMTVSAGLSISNTGEVYFNDTLPDAWYTPYINSARLYLTGYVTPYGSYYYPDQPALREDIAVAIVKLKGYDTFGADESLLSTMFTDSYSISSDSKKYVATALERGIISGYDDDTFRGQSSITRAEAAAMLWRTYQYGNDNKFITDESHETISINTPTPTTKPMIESTKKPEATKEPEVYEWISDTIDTGKIDQNNIAYNSNDNIIYYYNENDKKIYMYDISNDSTDIYVDVNDLYYSPKNNTMHTSMPDDEYSEFDHLVKQMYYDNYSDKLYVTMKAQTGRDAGALDDEELNDYYQVDVTWYINDNGEFVSEYECHIVGSINEGILKVKYGNEYLLLNPETFDEIGTVPSLSEFMMVDNGEITYLWYSTGGSGNVPITEIRKYDFRNKETIREYNLGNAFAMNSNGFYIWDEVKSRIVNSNYDGDLSVLLEFDDVKVGDMRKISTDNGQNRFIVTDDEDAIVFVDNNRLRIIKKAV